MSRLYGVVAILGALASLLPNFGIIDLLDGLTGAFTDDTAWVLDVAWGALFGVLIPVALFASLKREAGAQQLSIVTAAVAVAAVAGEAWRWLIPVAVLVAILALRPGRLVVPRLGPVWPLAALAVIPCAVYAGRAASAQRRHAPPSGAVSNGLHHWTGLAALAIAVALLAFGSRLLVFSAAAGAALWAVACVLHPNADGSEGRTWAVVVLVWAAVMVLTVMATDRRRAPGSVSAVRT